MFSGRFFRAVSCSLLLAIALCVAPAFAGKNLLQDPGFERYKMDKEKGYYVPEKKAAWKEIGGCPGSIRFDASKWKTPKEMVEEGRIGFSPGAAGYEGMGTDQNSGILIFQQDLVNPADFSSGPKYEAWVWLGGAGKDNEGAKEDRKDESGGWSATFYNTDNPVEWNDKTAIQTHESKLNFYGAPESFVRVSGFGSIPEGTKGIRFIVTASTWYPPSGPGNFDTRVAVDNAHFALLDKPNLLVNGDFEMDETPAQFKGWKRPAEYPFATKGFQPIDVNDVYNNRGYKNWDQNFDHGKFLPFLGQKWSYGYVTYMCGWVDDAFSFSQKVDYNSKDRAPLVLMCNWIQDTQQSGDAWQLRDRAGELEFIVQYFKGGKEISKETFTANWPSPSDSSNRCKYDLNGHTAYNPRFRVSPPAGTEQIGVNVNVKIRHPFEEGMSHVSLAVDDFWLGYE